MNRAAGATVFALLCFAANSVLCRMALRQPHIDPASFMSIRLCAGALTMSALLRVRVGEQKRVAGDWSAALVLLVYAVTFTFAYLGLTAGTGALLLFGAAQVAMIAAGVAGGERIDLTIACGWALAVGGLMLLLLPGASTPSARHALLMLIAGIAWGVYSLRGRRSQQALADTAGNFVRSVPGTLLISALFWAHRSADLEGIVLAAVSGSIASGLGYLAWYSALPRLGAIAAANAQLSVPVIAAIAGVVLFDEPITARLAAASVLVLGGTALAVRRRLTLQAARAQRGD